MVIFQIGIEILYNNLEVVKKEIGVVVISIHQHYLALFKVSGWGKHRTTGLCPMIPARWALICFNACRFCCYPWCFRMGGVEMKYNYGQLLSKLIDFQKKLGKAYAAFNRTNS